MASSVQICNMALSHLGVSKTIAAINEATAEAAACRQFYDQVRDNILRAFPWPFATTTAALALVTKMGDVAHPTTEWAYSYRYPTDCMAFRRIESGIRNDTQESQVPYRFARDTSGKLIYTDMAEAVGEFTFTEIDPGRYSADFSMAFSALLAVFIAPRVTGGDPFKMRVGAQQLYLQLISTAQATAGNEERPDQPPESEFIRARD